MGKLTETKLNELSKAPPRKVTRVGDGGDGLYAQVSTNGVISFWMKYRHRDPGSKVTKERADSIGRWGKDADKGEITLAMARNRVREIQVARAAGKDPRAVRKPVAEAAPLTFRDVAEKWLEHIEREGATMVGPKRYVAVCNDGFGDKLLDEVTVEDVSRVLHSYRVEKKIESEKRCRIVCGQVFRYAIALKRTQANPVAALIELTRKSPKPKRAVKHHAAMDAKEIPGFLLKVSAAGHLAPSVRLGMQFTALTMLRTGEVIDLRWSDIAKDGKSLTIPAERMKAGKAHTVFLSKQARAVIEEMRPFSEGRPYVFPGRDPKEKLSRMAMLMCMTRKEKGGTVGGFAPGYTVHGFRSSFSTWAHAKNVAAEAVIERCLAHAAGDEVAVAYNRWEYNKEAAKLWQRWADAISPK